MKQQKFGIALSKKDVLDHIPLVKKIGFDSFFPDWVRDPEQVKRIVEKGKEYEIAISSFHAPFGKVSKLWEAGEEGDAVEAELATCIYDCARYEVPVLVSHPFIGFDKHDPNPMGVTRYRRLGEIAQKEGVKIAIENVEGEEYLDYLLPNLRDLSSIGFCLDSGHEYCYNRARDLLADYGDMLCYLHINSNMGITDPNGSITFYDDAHMLPFDGIVDMESLAKRLKKCNFNGELTMELVKGNRPGRTCNDIYSNMTDEEHFTEAFHRIHKLAEMIEKF